MKGKKNKATKNRLEEFLEGREPADDFEKEALEGFSAFDADQLIEAQSELDARFSTRFRTSQESSSRRGYWAAAAALLIVSAFTGYFLLQNTKHPKDLALQQPARHTPPQTPEERHAVPSPTISQ